MKSQEIIFTEVFSSMKKINYLIICALMTMTLSSCGTKNPAGDTAQSSAVSAAEKEAPQEEAEELEEVDIPGMESMTDEELNEYLINEANEMDVVTDPKG